MFQFQNGAIARVNPGIGISITLEFQFQNGAIARLMTQTIEEYFDGVSIPKWCDCERRRGNIRILQRIVSIPKWCDCENTNQLKTVLLISFNSKMVRLRE